MAAAHCGSEEEIEVQEIPAKTSIPQNAYRMEVEDLVDSKGGMLVKRLVIRAHDKRTIRISVAESGHRQATLRADPRAGNDLVTGDVKTYGSKKA